MPTLCIYDIFKTNQQLSQKKNSHVYQRRIVVPQIPLNFKLTQRQEITVEFYKKRKCRKLKISLF